jgi:pimeloyl-ACP methyl ester carboxylesterase
MDDLGAVMDAAGLERAALVGAVDGGLAAMFAATHPERMSSLVLIGVSPSATGFAPSDQLDRMLDVVENAWGEGRLCPSSLPAGSATDSSRTGGSATSGRARAPRWPASSST